MKTKLLKIVRKRFSIIRYDYIDNPESILYGGKMPIFVMTDDNSGWGNHYCETYELALIKLLERIREVYYPSTRRRRNRNKSEKLWYNENK